MMPEVIRDYCGRAADRSSDANKARRSWRNGNGKDVLNVDHKTKMQEEEGLFSLEDDGGGWL